MNDIRQRIKSLRLELLQRNLDALYISGSDPHSSEYLTEHWQIRAFISGFSGSFGIVVITQEEAGLWTDPRYFLQATEQLKGTGIKMYKLRIPDAITPEKWLSFKLSPGSKVGFDPKTVTIAEYRMINNLLKGNGISMVETPDIFDKIWKNRPEIPQNKVFEFSTSYAGLSGKQKKELVITELKKYNANLQIISMTDELAWLFNLRGSDVPFNPVFTGYGVVGKDIVYLFVDSHKLPLSVKIKLEKENIQLADYNDFYSWIKTVKDYTIHIDPLTTNYAIYKNLCNENNIKEGTSVISMLKAQKNPVELQGFREAVKKDAVALTEFLFWLKENLRTGSVTEYTAANKLAEFRSLQTGYAGESFSPIVGYKEHGAMVHLSAGEKEALTLHEEGILLFDTGGHYLDGTTDITRTIALGEVSSQQKIDYTLVLKGLIALSRAKFPYGTKGWQIDVLARAALWNNGLNYGHGTGHGIGHYLNVHEGPVSIRHDYSEIPLLPGMVLSNEPGIYREGKYGIRIENIMACKKIEDTEFGTFLGFDTITLFPIDVNLIEIELLSEEEKNWLNSYHRRVKKEIRPLLKKELWNFFDELTAEIN